MGLLQNVNPLNLATGVQAGTGLLGSISSIINTNKTNRANMEMAKYAYSKDLEMWNRQNAYNDPSAQMLRYQSAGLNPNLIYGTGSASAGNATTLPKYQAPSMKYDYQPPNLTPMIGTYLDYKVKDAQIQSINAQTEGQRLQNVINSESLDDQITGKRFAGKNMLNVFDISKQKALYAGQSEWAKSSMLENQAMNLPRLLKAQLVNTITQNELQKKTLEKYSADIGNVKQSTIGKKIENDWYTYGGIKGTKDLVPFIQMIIKSMAGRK